MFRKNQRIKIAIALIFCFITLNSYAQSYLGLKGSFTISSMSTSEAQSRPGFNIGAMYSTHISDSWLFQPSLLFALDGVKGADKLQYGYSAYVYSIETPLIASWRMGDDEISFGLDMGIFTKYNLFGGYWEGSAEGRIKPNLFDNHKRFDIGPQLGFSIIAQGIYMGCGVQYGLIKPFSYKKGNYYNYFMSVGYLFEL